jgi:hypothetical protein
MSTKSMNFSLYKTNVRKYINILIFSGKSPIRMYIRYMYIKEMRG